MITKLIALLKPNQSLLFYSFFTSYPTHPSRPSQKGHHCGVCYPSHASLASSNPLSGGGSGYT